MGIGLNSMVSVKINETMPLFIYSDKSLNSKRKKKQKKKCNISSFIKRINLNTKLIAMRKSKSKNGMLLMNFLEYQVYEKDK